jgi:hypothetical protein
MRLHALPAPSNWPPRACRLEARCQCITADTRLEESREARKASDASTRSTTLGTGPFRSDTGALLAMTASGLVVIEKRKPGTGSRQALAHGLLRGVAVEAYSRLHPQRQLRCTKILVLSHTHAQLEIFFGYLAPRLPR